MSKWMWILIIGGGAAYFTHKTKQSYTWIVAGITGLAAYLAWKNGW